MITIFPCGSRRSKGMPSGRDVFVWLLVEELGTPKFAQIFIYGKWLCPCRMLVHGASDLDQRCLKTRNSEDGCTFPPNILARTPQNPTLGDIRKAYCKRSSPALRKSHVNGATKLKLYSYIGIGKYWGMGCVKLLSLGGVRGAQGPLLQNSGVSVNIHELAKTRHHS